MKKSSTYWLIAGFVISLFAVGYPFWQIPYSKVNLPDSLYGVGLIVVCLAALITRAVGKAHFFPAVLVGFAVPAAVLARVTIDTAKDPTSHNLWPIELMIAGVVGLFCSLIGTLVGSLPALFSKRD